MLQVYLATGRANLFLSKKIFKKKYLLPLLFLLIITGIFYSLFLGNTFVWADDIAFHMYRLIGSLNTLQDRQLLPRIYPYANNGYGYGTPLFYCDLFLLPFAFLLKTSLSLVTIYQLMIVFYGFLTSALCFLAISRLSKKSYTPYLVTLVYTFSAYRIYDIFGRTALGEILAFTFLPLVFLSVYEVLVFHKNSYLLLASSMSLLLLSHSITFLLTCFVILIAYLSFLFFNRHNINLILKTSKTLFVATLLALSLTAFHWLSMLEQTYQQDYVVKHLADYYRIDNHHLNFLSQFSPFLTYFKSGTDEIFKVISVGLNCLLFPLLGLLKKKSRAYYLMLLIGYFFFLLGLGLLPFYSHRTLSFLQFPFRYFIITYPILTFACIFVFDDLKTKWLKPLASLAITLCLIEFISFAYTYKISETRYSRYLKHDDIYKVNKDIKADYNIFQLSGAEYLPLPNINDFIRETVAIRQVNSDKTYQDIVYDFKRQFSTITFTYEFKEDSDVIFPLTFYRGYKVYEIVGGRKKEIPSYNEKRYNKLGFKAQKGKHTYSCHYEGTLIQKSSLVFSTITLIITIGIIVEKNKQLFIIKQKEAFES